MRDVDRWLREPKPGPVDPRVCTVCAALRRQVITAARDHDAQTAAVTLTAMQVHELAHEPAKRTA